MMRFILEAPPSANAMYRAVNGKVLKSAQYRKWIKAARVKIAAVLVNHPPRTRPDYMHARWSLMIDYYPNTKRLRDLDNLLKPILDALEGQVYLNDNQVDMLNIVRRSPNRGLEHPVVEVFAVDLDTRG